MSDDVPVREPTEIPENYSLRLMLEEIASTIRIRVDALAFKAERGKIGGAELGLAKIGIAKLRAVERLLKAIAAGDVALPADVNEATEREARELAEAKATMARLRAKVEEKPAPLAETLPPPPEPVVAPAPKVEDPDDDWD